MHGMLISPTRPARRAAQALAGVLVLALLCSQWLGMVHRVVHGPMPVLAGMQVQKSLQTAADTSTSIQVKTKAVAAREAVTGAGNTTEPGLSASAGVLGHVATPSKSDQDCRLYDQLGVSDALTAMPLLWAADVLRSNWVAPVTRCYTPEPVLVAARGPPLNF